MKVVNFDIIGAIFLWVSWRDQGLTWRVSLAPLPPLPFSVCSPASLSAPVLPCFTAFPRQLNTAGKLALTHCCFPDGAATAHSHRPNSENPQLLHECACSHSSLFFTDRRDTQLAAVWKLCLAATGATQTHCSLQHTCCMCQADANRVPGVQW